MDRYKKISSHVSNATLLYTLFIESAEYKSVRWMLFFRKTVPPPCKETTDQLNVFTCTSTGFFSFTTTGCRQAHIGINLAIIYNSYGTLHWPFILAGTNTESLVTQEPAVAGYIWCQLWSEVTWFSWRLLWHELKAAVIMMSPKWTFTDSFIIPVSFLLIQWHDVLCVCGKTLQTHFLPLDIMYYNNQSPKWTLAIRRMWALLSIWNCYTPVGW